MTTKVTYLKDANKRQLQHEKLSFIDVLRSEVRESSGKTRSIKLPQYIFFNLKNDASTLSIHIHEMDATENGRSFKKNPTCENMQSDNAAFEGWAICMKSWLNGIKKVELAWDIPSEETLKRGSSEQHYNRFLYRVMRFKEAFPAWFYVSKDCINSVSSFSLDFSGLRNNAYSKIPGKKQGGNRFGETDLEFEMTTTFKNDMLSFFNLDDIDRQFPVGIKKNGRQFFTGGLSAIDLWGVKDKTLSVIELKYIPQNGGKNIRVGIISELFMYSCVMRDIVRGVIAEPATPVVNEYEKAFYQNAKRIKQIKACMLANEFHPLIEDKKIFETLNANEFMMDIPVTFAKHHYFYDKEKKLLTFID